MAEVSLSTFLAASGRIPFHYGHADCLTRLADWILLKRGVDPAADYRCSYASEEEARALLRREGGILNFARKRMLAAGLEETDAPQAGDVALVRAPARVRGRDVMGRCGALVTDRGFALWPAGGPSLIVVPRRSITMMAAWRV